MNDSTKPDNDTSADEVSPDIDLTDKDKKDLLSLARSAIENELQSKPDKYFTTGFQSKNLYLERGLFVTLRKGPQLRGCIGHIQPMGPLYDEVSNVAILSATEDPRFPKVTVQELSELTIEITILSPFRKIDNPDKVIPGKHGLMIRAGYYQGLLLPQVAIDHGWDRETFLDQTCVKAGLFQGTWRDKKTEILVFTADYFEEE